MRRQQKETKPKETKPKETKPKSYVYPETEEERTATFRYLYELEKRTGAESAWDLLPALTVHMDKSMPVAEQYIVEYLTQPEKVIAAYIPLKEQVYSPTHYKTLSAQLTKFYADFPQY